MKKNSIRTKFETINKKNKKISSYIKIKKVINSNANDV